MCLIAFAWNAHPRWKLLLLGNRDEFHARPTAPLARWDSEPHILAGRDLEAGGTWMGLAAGGRAAVVTNVRDPCAATDGASRGLLVSDYLRGSRSANSHARQLVKRACDYRPFNLLLFDANGGVYLGNRPAPEIRAVTPGVHGLSNADYDTPWPKTQQLMARMREWLADESEDFAPLWDAMGDGGQWPDNVLPDTGIGIELERRLSAAFIRGEQYGTRASTFIAIDHAGHGRIIECSFGPDGVALGKRAMTLNAW